MSNSNVVVLPVTRAAARVEPTPEEPSPAVGARVSRYGYCIGPMNFLVPTEMVSEITVAPAITPLPRGVPWLEGFTNMRGNIVPIFNLQTLIDLPYARAERRTVLLLDRGSRMLGIVVDGLPQALLQPGASSELPLLNDRLAGFVRCGFVLNGSVWVEFDAHGFFTQFASTSTSSQNAALREQRME